MDFAEVGGGTHGVAERTVVGAGVLGGVGHYARVDETFILEALADDADAAVHHVGGRNDVGAGSGLSEYLLDEHFDRLVVQDVAFFVDEAVLTVRGVRVKRNVGHHAELRIGGLEGLDGARDQAVGVRGFTAVGRLQGFFDVREERDHRNAEFHALAGDLEEFVDAQAVDAGHGRNRLAKAGAPRSRRPGESDRWGVTTFSRIRRREKSS